MTIDSGDRVAIEYVGRFEDGSVFNTSQYEVAVEHGLFDAQERSKEDYAPQSFVVGAGEVIEGLDEAVVGMAVGDEATVTVPPENAYGEFDDERVRTYDPEAFEAMVGEEPEVGLHVHAENGLHGDVIAVRDDAVEVDFNHELAGKTLVFDVEVVAVE
ncbi:MULTISPECIES: peptidylprolyl isomerase [Haloferax]|uniref:Peptidyl-prolyl cis-trans isomerase n=1 Tax=Haloferax marinum TaxID=2666143 RepID=A0A6A8G7N4_9EURY|nr:MULTISPECIES: peptidylprolyl isomerase [Haloferax]KAB1197809.1 peptidylprolyl isomerase [Haloferax sp. CBA1150]MRW96867.1 peptidylprolyl isomerase [Haloferax marinum]